MRLEAPHSWTLNHDLFYARHLSTNNTKKNFLSNNRFLRSTSPRNASMFTFWSMCVSSSVGVIRFVLSLFHPIVSQLSLFSETSNRNCHHMYNTTTAAATPCTKRAQHAQAKCLSSKQFHGMSEIFIMVHINSCCLSFTARAALTVCRRNFQNVKRHHYLSNLRHRQK